MDRRKFLSLGGPAALALFAPPGIGFVASAAEARGAKTLVLADPRYRDSLLFARSLKREGASVFSMAPNGGKVWFDDIEPRVQAGLRLAGLTLESDLFVLQRLAEPTGALTHFTGWHDWRSRPASVHRLCGSIDLEAIATALVRNEGHWAGRLGKGLGAAAERGQERRELNVLLNQAMPAAHSPRFFVSWLMTWTS